MAYFVASKAAHGLDSGEIVAAFVARRDRVDSRGLGESGLLVGSDL